MLCCGRWILLHFSKELGGFVSLGINLVRFTLHTLPLLPVVFIPVALAVGCCQSAGVSKPETWAELIMEFGASILFLSFLDSCPFPMGMTVPGLHPLVFRPERWHFFNWSLSLPILSDYSCQNGKLNLVQYMGLNYAGSLILFVSCSRVSYNFDLWLGIGICGEWTVFIHWFFNYVGDQYP